MLFKLNKGLELPLNGEPEQRIDVAKEVSTVAALGTDYVGLKPTMLVREGDAVKIGQPLFEDKKNPGVIITSPAAGSVREINRGLKRALESVVIDIDERGEDVAIPFKSRGAGELPALDAAEVRETLHRSGLWSSFRTRPYSRVPQPGSTPASIFVTAMDTNPLSADPAVIIEENRDEFENGLVILSRLGVPVYVCTEPGAGLPQVDIDSVLSMEFAGPHPSGLPGTHMHLVDPVSAGKIAWHLGYQDVIAMGALFVTGRLRTERIVALGGPMVNSPRLLRTRLGASTEELLQGALIEGEARVVSGSVFNGQVATGPQAYLGRYHNQLTILREGREREFMGWIAPGMKKYSAINVFLSSLFPGRSFDITTNKQGSPRAIVPIGVFEKVMPLDILPTPLLKALLVKDTDSAQALGCLELDEEDLALCSFVDPGKHDFGPVLRENLAQIEREG